MTTITSIEAQTRALGYEFHRHDLSETQTEVVVDLNTDPNLTPKYPDQESRQVLVHRGEGPLGKATWVNADDGDSLEQASTAEIKGGNPYTVRFSKDREWSLQEVHEVILRELAPLTPVTQGKGAQADNPEKDKLRAKSIPQPGAQIVEGEPGAIPTGINTETYATPAQGAA